MPLDFKDFQDLYVNSEEDAPEGSELFNVGVPESGGTSLPNIDQGCDNPEELAVRTTALTHLDADIRERAHKLCCEYLRGAWKKINAQQLDIRKVSGGLSNLLYYCALPASQPAVHGEATQVLLRLYGQLHGERALEGLVTEAVIFTMLSENQRGPRLLGVFPGGRLEEYIPARPLRTSELSDPALSRLVAGKLAQIHQMDVPINKEPRWLWDTMYRDFLVSIKSPVVFCHNDLQEGNILLRLDTQENQDQPELVVIDFEFCSYNYRGFDIANHMCEWIYDYSNENAPYFWASEHSYPSLEQQTLFLESYLQAFKRESQSKQKPTNMEQLIKELQAFTLASHFFWGLWSVCYASISTIPFDYWEYGEVRFEAYFKHKELIFNATEESADSKTITNLMKTL